MGEVRSRVQKMSKKGLSQTLSGGFSPTREHSFRFSTLAQKSSQKGAQKLSKWRPGALEKLSGDSLKNMFEQRPIFGRFLGTLK